MLNMKLDWNTCTDVTMLCYLIKQLWTFYWVNLMWYLLNLTVFIEVKLRSILSISVNISPYLLIKNSVIIYYYPWYINRCGLECGLTSAFPNFQRNQSRSDLHLQPDLRTTLCAVFINSSIYTLWSLLCFIV